MENRKWSWTEFIVGWIDKQFIIWGTATVLVFMFIKISADVISERIKFALVIAWIIISICLFFYKSLNAFIKNGKLNVEAKANIGVTKDIK